MSTPNADTTRQASEVDLLGQFLRRSIGLQSITQSRLTKFKGSPLQPGELSLSEWLEEFEGVTARQNISDGEKAQLLLDNLAGPAREEVMCLPDESRQKYSEMVGALKLYFGYQDNTQNLSSQLHNRVQREGESLCDYSRAILRIYIKMEKAAQTEEQAQALQQLKDKTLTDQFINGAREAWVRRELRRIQMKEGSFAKVREEALRLFQEAPTPSRVRARELAEVAQLTPATNTPEGGLLREMVDQQQTILAELSKLKDEVATLKRQRVQRRRLEDVECFKCGNKGHYRKDCPQLNGTPSSPQPAEN